MNQYYIITLSIFSQITSNLYSFSLLQYIHLLPASISMDEHQQQQNHSLFLKQYLCYEFYTSLDRKIAQTKEASFQHQNIGQQKLEPICYDNYSAQPLLYFVHWQDTVASKVILIKKQDEDQWYKIALNRLPIKVKITDNCAFLIGSSQLIIIPLKQNGNARAVDLQAGEIVDVKLCFSKNRQSGIYIVYFDKKRGYNSQTYTKSTQGRYWTKIAPYLNLSFSTFEPYHHLEVILPNILALAVKNQNLYLFDLHTMKETSSVTTISDVGLNQKFNIKWKLSQSHQGQDDTLNVFVCRKNIIQAFSISIFRKSIKIEINGQETAEKVQINRIIGGDIIDWTKTSIRKTQFSVETVSSIIDFEVNQQQLIYSYFQQGQSYIPTILIVGLDAQWHKISQILSVQHSNFRYFLENKFRNQTDNENGETKKKCVYKPWLNGKKILEDYDSYQSIQNHYRFYGFITAENKFWSIRSNSLTTFQPITEIQFTAQRQNQTFNQISQSEKLINSVSQYKMKKIGQSLKNYSSQAQVNHYKELIYELKRSVSRHFTSIIQENIIQNYISQSFYKSLVGNIAVDYLKHFNIFAQYCFKVLQLCESSQQSLAIYRITSFLEDIGYGQAVYFEPEHNLLSTLINQICSKLYNKGELSVCLIFKRLFENILPDHYIKQPENSGKQNFLLQVIIDIFLKQKESVKLEYLQYALSQYFNRLEQLQKGVFNCIVAENSSVFMAFILCHPQKEKIASVFKTLYGKKHYQIFITNLRKIKQYVPDQLEILLELQLNAGPNQSKLNYSHFVEFAQKSIVFENEVKEVCRTHIVEEMVLYNSEESFKQNIQLQKSLLAQLKKASFSNFADLNNRLVGLSQRQLSFDILKRDFQHILQWQENILCCYSSLFNQKLPEIQNVQRDKLQLFVMYLVNVLKQIQASFQSYYKYYNQYYRGQKKILRLQGSTLDMIQASMENQERVMSNIQLSKPVKVYKYRLSNLAIKAIRTLLESLTSIEQIRESKLLSKEAINELLLLNMRRLLKKTKLRWEDVDVLQFILLKQGQRQFNELIRQFLPEDLNKIVSFLEQKKEQGYLYGLVNKIKSPEEISVQKYKNPFAVY